MSENDSKDGASKAARATQSAGAAISLSPSEGTTPSSFDRDAADIPAAKGRAERYASWSGWLLIVTPITGIGQIAGIILAIVALRDRSEHVAAGTARRRAKIFLLVHSIMLVISVLVIVAIFLLLAKIYRDVSAIL
jgi:hypothetical protein